MGLSGFESTHKCDPTTQNELHWYSVTIQSAMIFDLQVKNIDFQFSLKSGAKSGHAGGIRNGRYASQWRDV